MNKKIIIFIMILSIVAAVVLTYFYFTQSGKVSESFKVDSLFLKNGIKKSGSVSSQIIISNIQDSESNFQINVTNLEGLLHLEEANFLLAGGEQKKLGLLISNPASVSEGVYAGTLEISNEKDTKEIPVILEIESEDVLFDSTLDLFPVGKIFPGDKINSEIKVYDLFKLGIARVDISYRVQDFKGQTIFSETENAVIKDQAQVSKSFTLPMDIAPGYYVFEEVLKYENSTGTASQLFIVSKKEDSSANSLISNYYLIFAGFLIIAIILIIIYRSISSKDNLLIELRKQYAAELAKQEKSLETKEKENEKLLKSELEKDLNRKLFMQVREKRKNELKNMCEERERKVKTLRKSDKREELKKQLETWKQKGYDVTLLEQKIKAPKIEDIKKKIKLWKQKGYDVSPLE